MNSGKKSFLSRAKEKSLLMQIADGTSLQWRKLFQFTCNIVRINYQQLNPQLISLWKQERKRKKNIFLEIFSSFLRFRNVWGVSSDLVMQISVLQSIMTFHFFPPYLSLSLTLCFSPFKQFFYACYCCALKRKNKEADDNRWDEIGLEIFLWIFPRTWKIFFLFL